MKIAQATKYAYLATALLLPGCQSFYRGLQYSAAGQPRISDQAYLQTAKAINAGTTNSQPATTDATSEDLLPEACKNDCKDSKDNKDNKDNKNYSECVNQMLLLINIRWQHYVANLVAYSNAGTLLLDSTNLALNGAGALASGGTSKVLSAIAGGLTGFKSTFDSDVLQQHTITAVINEMVKDRKTQLAVIEQHLQAESSGYSSPPPAAPAANDGAPGPATPADKANSSPQNTADGAKPDTSKPVKPYSNLAGCGKTLPQIGCDLIL
jgi:hypothetical protein